MNESLVKQIISTLDRNAFSKFIYELWKIEDYSNDLNYQKTKLIGENIFQQHYWEKSSNLGVYEHQGYNLIIPFFQPIELFSNPSENLFSDTYFIRKLKNYKRRITRTKHSWVYALDGMYHIPLISFVTNFEGLDGNLYFDIIIPEFEQLVNKLNIEAETAVGSCDSFFELHPENTFKAFKNFINSNQGQVSISILGDKLEFSFFNQDKYLTKGILKSSKTPYEPVYVDKFIDKSEIIKEFEFLINTKNSETTLENFLKIHYKDIFGFHYDRIETQLWLKFPELDISDKNRRLDIFLRNSIARDWELFELKNVKKLTRTYRDIPTFTSEIHNAIQQVRAYEKLLSQAKVKEKFAREGIEYYYPEIRLVVGNKPDISDEQWRFLKSTNENSLKIITFDELLESMKLRYKLRNLNTER